MLANLQHSTNDSEIFWKRGPFVEQGNDALPLATEMIANVSDDTPFQPSVRYDIASQFGDFPIAASPVLMA